MKNIIRICNIMVRFSKFILNIKIYEKFVEFLSKLVWKETLFQNMTLKKSYNLKIKNILRFKTKIIDEN